MPYEQYDSDNTIFRTLLCEPSLSLSEGTRETLVQCVGEHQWKSTTIDNPNTSHVMSDLTPEDIEELTQINDNVQKGKQRLLDCLEKYNDCCKRQAEHEQSSIMTHKAFESIYDNLTTLAHMHKPIDDFCKGNLFKTLLQLEDEVTSEIGCELALVQIQKDRFAAMVKFLSKTYGILKDTPLTHTCPVCITNEVDMYLEPCGHTLCRNCLLRRPVYCHMCRTKIRLSKNIYYS